MHTAIMFFSAPCILACDGQCNKAWGINNRPRKQLSEDEDDFVFLADDQLGQAPADPGAYEGGYGKPSATPTDDPSIMNKWCARECERSSKLKPSEPITLKDFTNPTPNMPFRHAAYQAPKG